MANELYIYPHPKEAHVQLRLDSGTVLSGVGPLTANGRDDAHAMYLPHGTPSQGGVLEISHESYHDFSNRGLVVPSETGEATFKLDDVDLIPIEVAPTPTPPVPAPSDDPEAIINEVYATGDHDLSTHDGCGQFTEACCEQLHTRHSDMWGHIAKSGGQNQYNGHAVDAVMLLAGPECGIYDIVHDSVAPTASPQYIYKGPPDPSLWYYDAGAAAASAGTKQAGPLILAVLKPEELALRAWHTQQAKKK